MDVFFARNRLSAYIDGELPDAEMAEVANAIEEDPELKAEYTEMLRAVEFLRRKGPVSAPSTLHANVMRAVDDLPMPRRGFRWWGLPRFSWEGMAVAAVAVTVLVLAWVAPQTTRRSLEQAGPATPSAQVPAQVLGESQVPGSDPAEVEPVLPPPMEANDGLDLAGRKTDSLNQAGESTAPPEGVPSQVRPLVRSRPGAPFGQLDGVYVPEWDQEKPTQPVPESQTRRSGSTGLASADPPVAYMLYPNHPNALKGISDTAYRLGGTALTASGDALVPFDLTVEKNHARVIIQVPLDQIGVLESQLRALGGVVPVNVPSSAAPGAGAVPIYVEVLYEP